MELKPAAEVAVIGGSGMYGLFDTEPVVVDTPYGPPSAPVEVAEIDGTRVAFLARHGRDHRLPPHMINYRANLAALASLGATMVLAPCAAGSLRADAPAGTLVVPDQMVDRTGGRVQTFHDDFPDGPVHASFADPYCSRLRTSVVDAARQADWDVRPAGTMVVVDGPRFSTRAESQWFASQGWDVVNMTGHPEAVLARELGMCYASLALVTDLDAGVAAGEGVSTEQVLAEFARNLPRLRDLVLSVAGGLGGADTPCTCAGGPG